MSPWCCDVVVRQIAFDRIVLQDSVGQGVLALWNNAMSISNTGDGRNRDSTKSDTLRTHLKIHDEKHMGVWCCLLMSINVDAHLCPAVKVTAHVFGPSWMGNTRLEKVSDRRIGSVAHNGWLIKKWMEKTWKNDLWKIDDFPVCVSEYLEQFLAVSVQMCSGCGEANQWHGQVHIFREGHGLTWPDMAWHGLTPDHPMTCFFHPAWFPHFAPTWAKQAIEVKI